METPVFKLEGIVKLKDEMTDFEGPLTLILLLLSKDKIEIRDISISLILEQYLAYLENMTGYFQSVEYGILVLIAADGFMGQLFKDIENTED